MSNVLGVSPHDADESTTDLHRRYGAWLKMRLDRRYGTQDSEDLVQETWLRVVPYGPVGHIEHPKALLLTIATNIARNMGVKRGIRRTHAAQVSADALELPSQFSEVLGRQLMLGLPQPLRDVFVLSRIVGLSNAQIAEQLGISPKTVEGRMTKALAHCAAQLRR